MFGAGGIHSVWRPRYVPLPRSSVQLLAPPAKSLRSSRSEPTDPCELDEPGSGLRTRPGPTLGPRLSCIAARSRCGAVGSHRRSSRSGNSDIAIRCLTAAITEVCPCWRLQTSVSRRGFERSPHVSKAAGSGTPVSATEGFVLRAGESAGRRGGLARRRSRGAARARRTLRSRTIVRYASRTEGVVGRAPRVPARRGMDPALPYSRRGAPSPR